MRKMTIRMTGRRPVSIDATEWPIVACARHDSFSPSFHASLSQSEARGELEIWALTVRHHEDGRTLVHGSYDPAFTGEVAAYAGELCSGDDVVGEAIVRVSRDIKCPVDLAGQCLSDFTPEEI